MSEPDHSDIADASQDAPADADVLITSLRAAGAEQFDPVHMRYLDVLAKHATAHRGSARRMLDARLAQALATFKERFEHAQREARDMLGQHARQYPHAATDLQRFFDVGDFKGLRRFAAALQTSAQPTSLAELVRQLERHHSENADARVEENAGSRPELKTVRQFRNTLSRLSVQRQVVQALERAPKNAGPINSHMLVLRSLALMRDISPDYLSRFMSYTDTLLCLGEFEKETQGNPQKPPVKRAAKK